MEGRAMSDDDPQACTCGCPKSDHRDWWPAQRIVGGCHGCGECRVTRDELDDDTDDAATDDGSG